MRRAGRAALTTPAMAVMPPRDLVSVVGVLTSAVMTAGMFLVGRRAAGGGTPTGRQ
jgi:hypothetical protein